MGKEGKLEGAGILDKVEDGRARGGGEKGFSEMERGEAVGHARSVGLEEGGAGTETEG